MNLKPELVEKKEPPIMTKIRKTSVKFDCSWFIEKPILETLVDRDKRPIEKSLLKLKKRKKIVITTIKYTIRWKSS